MGWPEFTWRVFLMLLFVVWHVIVVWWWPILDSPQWFYSCVSYFGRDPGKRGLPSACGALGLLQKSSPAVTDTLHGTLGLTQVKNRGCQAFLKLRFRVCMVLLPYTSLVKSRRRPSPDGRGRDPTRAGERPPTTSGIGLHMWLAVEILQQGVCVCGGVELFSRCHSLKDPF